MALSERHKAFVEEYLSCFNATEAYARVWRPAKRPSAAANGYKMLRNPDVAEAISQRLSETAMTADEVLMRLAAHARGDMGDYLTTTGELDLSVIAGNIQAEAESEQVQAKPPNKKTGLLKKITQKRTRRTGESFDVEEIVTSIELYDAQSALKILGDHHGLFKGNPAENPQHVVTHTHDEWVADREKRQQQAAAALADFDDE